MKILIVEDEVGIVQFLQQGLEEEEYEITTAYDGLMAFELIQKEKFDLILLDWMLPKMNDIESSIVGLFGIGAAITLLTGKSILFSGMRQVAFGLAAAAVTYGIGTLIGVSLAG
jgi:chemotaxis response regulator CheB